MPKQSQNLPTYDLDTIKNLIRSKARTITIYAEQNIIEECLSKEMAYEIVLDLKPGQFRKTMKAEKMPGSGLFQDVYRYDSDEYDLYVKVQIFDDRGIQKARLIDMKAWGKA
jgi:hypothetical protein